MKASPLLAEWLLPSNEILPLVTTWYQSNSACFNRTTAICDRTLLAQNNAAAANMVKVDKDKKIKKNVVKLFTAHAKLRISWDTMV